MNVLVLGAGFSAPAGLPGIADFVPLVLEDWNAIARSAGLRSREAAEYRQKVDRLWNEKKRPDIETLLESVASSPQNRARVAHFIKIGVSGLSRRYIRDELRPMNRRTLDADFEGFARYVEIRRPTIVSFNWDMICEYLIRGVLGMQDDHGIEFDVAGEERGGGEKDEEGDRSPGWRRPAGREKVVVLKPFGSVSWTLCPGCGLCVDHGRHVTDRLLSSPPKCARCGDNIQPLIVSPNMRGASGRGIPQISETWNLLEKALGSAQSVCVCGYSFGGRDAYFTRLVECTAGQAKRLRRLTVINPDKKAGDRLYMLFGNALGVFDEPRDPHRGKRKWKESAPPKRSGESMCEEDEFAQDQTETSWSVTEPAVPSLPCEEYDSFSDWLHTDGMG